MTIQKKLMISNIVATTITALMIGIICVAYVHFHSETLPNEIRESSGGVNKLTKIMNILYTYSSCPKAKRRRSFCCCRNPRG